MKRLSLILKRIAGPLCLIWILGASVCYGDPITVTLDTSVLIGGGFSLVFDLIDGDAVADNTATVSNVEFGGGNLVGSPTVTGGATGSLSGVVTLTDSVAFFNEFFQGFNPGSLLSFDLDFTTNFAGGTPDSLTFSIVDNSIGFPIPTLAPLGTDVFLAVDLDSSSPLIQTFGTDLKRTTLALTAPTVSPAAIPIPAPNSLLLVGTGLGGLALVSRQMRKSEGKGGGRRG